MTRDPLHLRVFSPHPDLARYVHSYWTIQTPPGRSLQAPSLRYLHPDAGHGINLNFGDAVVTDTGERGTGFTVGSKLVGPATLAFRGHVRMTGVRFRPHGAYAFFRTSTLCADACRPSALRALYGAVEQTTSSGEAGAVLDSWLMARFERAKPSPVIPFAVGEIFRSGGVIRVETLARDLDISPRHLERLFRSQVGYTPKQLARIARARRAKRVISALDGRSLSDIAYSVGYSDQAHFAREFSGLIGISPLEYRRCVAARGKTAVRVDPLGSG